MFGDRADPRTADLEFSELKKGIRLTIQGISKSA